MFALACAFVAASWPRDDGLNPGLSEADRQRAYAHLLDAMEAACTQQPGPEPSHFCQTTADLIMDMPECDASCQGFARPMLPRPTR